VPKNKFYHKIIKNNKIKIRKTKGKGGRENKYTIKTVGAFTPENKCTIKTVGAFTPAVHIHTYAYT
jgi:hypothetical protein